MRRSVFSLLLLCLAALCLSANAARVWGNPLITGREGLETIKAKLREAAAPLKKGDDINSKEEEKVEEWLDRPGFAAVRYRVPPSMHDEFVDEWNQLYKQVDKKEDKKNMYVLSKTVQDNLYFTTYGEWDTIADYIEHFHSGHVMNFLEFLEDKDITWELFPLKNVTSIKKETRKMRDPSAIDNKKGKGEERACISFTYHADPSVKHDFIDAWEDMAQGVWKQEKGNMAFALRKVGTNNHHFMGYGSWDSWEDFMEHISSKHVKNFRDFACKNDILYNWELVMRVHGDSE